MKVYTTPICPYCELTKSFLRENGIEFEEIDVSSDKEAAREMIMKSGQMGVPVIEIDDKIIVGFDVKALKEALGLE